MLKHSFKFSLVQPTPKRGSSPSILQSSACSHANPEAWLSMGHRARVGARQHLGSHGTTVRSITSLADESQVNLDKHITEVAAALPLPGEPGRAGRSCG